MAFRKPSLKTESTAHPNSTLVRGGIDRPMFIIILLLLCFGAVMVFSSSYAYAYSQYGNSAYFIEKQLLYAGIGLVAMWVAAWFPYKFYHKYAWLIFGVSTFLLLLVLVIGTAEDEARRWLDLKIITFQPSEISKFALVLIIARLAQRFRVQTMKRDGTMKTYWSSFGWGTVLPMFFVGLTCLLVMLEKHLSGTIILFCIGAACVWVAGGKRIVYVIGLALIALVAYVLLFQLELLESVLEEYQFTRIDLWLNPEKYSKQGAAWQTLQGLYAVGSGGIFGRGIGNSLQKHLFVSQPQNDFIFAIICEELGFIGACALIVLYLVFFVRALQLAKRAPDVFAAVTIIGIASHVMLQALLNMMVVTAILPNTGISLPFISYGGSSLFFLLVEMGILLSVSRYTRVQK